MGVPVCIDALASFQHFVKIESAIQRKLHLSPDKLLRGNMRRLQQIGKLFKPLLLQLQKIAVAQAEKFLFALILLQNLQQLVLRQLRRRNFKLQKTTLYRHADADRYALSDMQLAERLRALHLAEPQQL